MKQLDEYPWCGHSAPMNKRIHEWQNVDYVYRLFSEQKKNSPQKISGVCPLSKFNDPICLCRRWLGNDSIPAALAAQFNNLFHWIEKKRVR